MELLILLMSLFPLTDRKTGHLDSKLTMKLDSIIVYILTGLERNVILRHRKTLDPERVHARPDRHMTISTTARAQIFPARQSIPIRYILSMEGS